MRLLFAMRSNKIRTSCKSLARACTVVSTNLDNHNSSLTMVSLSQAVIFLVTTCHTLTLYNVHVVYM